MIDVRPYDAPAALSVFERLDRWDLFEAGAVRGGRTHYLSLFADWHAVHAANPLAWVLHVRQPLRWLPFAVVGIANTGQAGVGGAAFLSCNHDLFARPIAQAAVLIRDRMPVVAQQQGIGRIEARCLAAHPTASRFLTYLGFAHEADMPGFGGRGAAHVFRQFAWTPDQPDPQPAPDLKET
ncbi:hypothetical protein ACVDG3_18225 [Meridianimarinicoccus sp. RP-17]|uniref:hypothetical protein n=1 Tax=Meridianimarinicoccus zhengii TaxID=2056810 RepID=UPI000DAD6445|nr:hypothetical protein [Phycocomes zhengii]